METMSTPRKEPEQKNNTGDKAETEVPWIPQGGPGSPSHWRSSEGCRRMACSGNSHSRGATEKNPKWPIVLGSWTLGRSRRTFLRAEHGKGRSLEGLMPYWMGGPGLLENPKFHLQQSSGPVKRRVQALELWNPPIQGAAAMPPSPAAIPGAAPLCLQLHQWLRQLPKQLPFLQLPCQ